ncbi:hypothetical protein [uncultured Draconibacterium sp.]|uniref:hypothetical protein n=1 Tax=uncultured Draconibacterium sp. TaxID=1573823 RepID=UPI003217074B
MDLNIILGWSITLLAITLLIFFIKVKNKKRDEKTLEPLLKFASEHNSEISQYNSWDKTIIGVDTNETSRLFFIRNIPGMEIRETINLLEVSDCKMVKAERKVKYQKHTVNVIDRIQLVFSFYKHKSEIRLEFYNEDYDQLTLSGELQLAQKWASLVKDIIIKNRELKDKKRENAGTNPLVEISPLSNLEFAKNRKYKRPVKMGYAV